MPGKRVNIDDETWMALDLLARDRMATFQELADEALADLELLHGSERRGAVDAVGRHAQLLLHVRDRGAMLAARELTVGSRVLRIRRRLRPGRACDQFAELLDCLNRIGASAHDHLID